MQVASHTNPKNLPLDSDGKRGWTHSFFGCFDDCGTCRFPLAAFVLVEPHPPVPGLTATFCPCIVYSKISSRLDHLSNRGSPHPSGGDACSGACVGYAATCYCGISCILQVRFHVITNSSRRKTQPPHRRSNEGGLVVATTSPVTVVLTASLPVAATFATSSRSLVRSKLRRGLMRNRLIEFHLLFRTL